MRAVLTIVMLVFLLSGCTWAKARWGQKSDRTDTPAVEAQATNAESAKQELQGVVENFVRSENGAASERKDRLVYKSPYYFREYCEYPEGSSGSEIVFRETDAKTTPFVADVKLKKIRYATRLHRERNDALGDTSFLRDTGQETLTFELHSSKWRKAGSLFYADKTEENVNGEWVPAQEKIERTIASEEQPDKSFLGKIWSGITGR
jgi:outer membrane lipoprotein-sorting protein